MIRKFINLIIRVTRMKEYMSVLITIGLVSWVGYGVFIWASLGLGAKAMVYTILYLLGLVIFLKLVDLMLIVVKFESVVSEILQSIENP